MMVTPKFANKMKLDNLMLKHFPNGIGLWGEKKGTLSNIKTTKFPIKVFMTRKEHRNYVICLVVGVACLIGWTVMLWKL